MESNTKERYITDKLSFSGSWSTDYGGVDNNGSSVEQSFRHPGLSLSNRFRYMRSSGPLMWDASSRLLRHLVQRPARDPHRQAADL